MTKCWAQIHSFEDFGKHKGVHINVFSTELIFLKILDNVKYITENGYLKEILDTLIFIFLSHCGPLWLTNTQHSPMFSTYNILCLFIVSLWFFFIMIETNKYVQIVLSCSCTELPCIYQIQWHYLSRTGI